VGGGGAGKRRKVSLLGGSCLQTLPPLSLHVLFITLPRVNHAPVHTTTPLIVPNLL